MRRLGWVMVACGCGPLVEVGETGETGDSSGGSPTTSASTSVGTSVGTSGTSTTTSTTAPTTVSTTTDTGEPGPRACLATCEVPLDCCFAFAGDDDCQGMFGSYPYNYGCEANLCRFLGCTSDEDCTFDGALEGWFCIPGDGDPPVCQPGCTQDSDCEDQFLAGWVCNGTYCTPPLCAEDDDCGVGLVCNAELGECTSGCTSDEQCSGFGVCDVVTGTCVCTGDDQCSPGFTCAPYEG